MLKDLFPIEYRFPFFFQQRSAFGKEKDRLMGIWHLRPNRKPTGGFLNISRKKRRSDRGSEFLETKIGKRKIKIKRTKGGGSKVRLMLADVVNVSDKNGKAAKAKIMTVVDSPANPNYIRRNVLTKGSVIKTELGNVRITSRPSQDGVVNGVLIEEKK